MSNINWDELRIKVEEDFNKEANENSINEYCSNCSECSSRKDCIGLPTVNGSDRYDFADEHGLLDDDGNEISEDDPDAKDIEYEDNDDEKEEISAAIWRKNTPVVKNGDFLGIEHPNMFYPKENFDYAGALREAEKDLENEYDDIQCPHFTDASLGVGEVYIYPINQKTRMCLCKTCNANLASKMLGQLALETFI